MELSRSSRPSSDDGIRARGGASQAVLDRAMAWLNKHRDGLQRVLNSTLVRNYVFEPFKGLFDFTGDVTEVEVRRTITMVALMNATMAAVPGSMGYGLFVAIALETYMAFRIARLLGFAVSSPAELTRTVGAAAVTVLGTGMVFKEVFGFFWRALAFIPGPGSIATFMAEYATTVVIGALFWVTFDAIKSAGGRLDDGTVVAEAFQAQVSRAWEVGAGLLRQQWTLLRTLLRPRTFRTVADRARAFLSGEVAVDEARLRGDVFVPVAMAWLMAKETERLDGPLGELFIESVRRAVPSLANATIDEMGDFMRHLDGEHLEGMMSLLKGELFEAMVVKSINAGSDGAPARLHEDRTVPGSDMIMPDPTGTREMLVSLKATDDASYIAQALARYPDIPIMTTDEVAEFFSGNDMVMPSGIKHAELLAVTQENYDELLWQLPSAPEVVGGGLTFAAFVSLYPFVVAWRRGKITQDQFKAAVHRVFGTTSRALVSRLALTVALGPVFGWYLLARGAGFLAQGAIALAEEPELEVERTTYVLRPGASLSQ